MSATIITLLLTSKAGIAVGPLIIIAVVVAYITIQTLSATRLPPAPATATAPAAQPQPAAPAPPQPQTTATGRMTTGHHDRGQRPPRCGTTWRGFAAARPPRHRAAAGLVNAPPPVRKNSSAERAVVLTRSACIWIADAGGGQVTDDAGVIGIRAPNKHGLVLRTVQSHG